MLKTLFLTPPRPADPVEWNGQTEERTGWSGFLLLSQAAIMQSLAPVQEPPPLPLSPLPLCILFLTTAPLPAVLLPHLLWWSLLMLTHCPSLNIGIACSPPQGPKSTLGWLSFPLPPCVQSFAKYFLCLSCLRAQLFAENGQRNSPGPRAPFICGDG